MSNEYNLITTALAMLCVKTISNPQMWDILIGIFPAHKHNVWFQHKTKKFIHNTSTLYFICKATKSTGSALVCTQV